MPHVRRSTEIDSAPRIANTLGSRLWFGAGLALVLSGVVHTLVWLVDGGAWTGPISWRKPILFGFSAGLTALSLGWVLRLCRPVHGDGLLAGLASAALLVEVALISAQTWRGVPSHFNESTPLDRGLHWAMDGLITVVVAYVVWLTARAFRSLDAPPDVRLAARSGLSLLLLSSAIGFVILFAGRRLAEAGLDPTTYGRAGALKFPHGVAIHALQWLPLLAWAQRRAGFSIHSRTVSVGTAAFGSTILVAYAIAQTALGRGRFDVIGFTLPLLALGVAASSWPWMAAACRYFKSDRRGLECNETLQAGRPAVRSPKVDRIRAS